MDKILDNNYISVWFMRQAGRYLPEYKKIRQTEKSFIDLCFNSEKSATISLQPIERFDFDYIILFANETNKQAFYYLRLPLTVLITIFLFLIS